MSDIPLIFLTLVLPGCIILYLIGGLIYAFWYDRNNPPQPIYYTWHNIWPDYKGEWQKGHATKVYYNTKTHDIRGKVVMQKDGLYLATMYNGDDKEFMLDSLAQKWVEEYKARVYK